MPADTKTRTTDKDWWMPWIFALQGYPPTEQTIALWMGYLANEDGIVDNFSWEELSDLVGLQPASIRKIMKKDLEVYDAGLLERQERKVGRVTAMPLFYIHLFRFWTPEDQAA